MASTKMHSQPGATPAKSASQPPAAAQKRFRGRLKIDAQFCPADVADPFDTVEWQTRSAQIKGEDGELIFEQTNCEVPSFWSQLATNVICSKYFYGEVNTPEREHTVRQLIHRVARTIADWGVEDGYFATPQDGERFYRDLAWLCLHQHGAFNSPVWFNVGLYHQYGVTGSKCNWHWDPITRDVKQPENPYEYPQGSACFIQHVQDNMEDIMELARSEAMLFKFGSGTGTDLSTLRSHRERLSGGGRPSGPLSFMRVYDQIAAVVKSGGKTRRAAKMQSLKIWHPDIMEFIECKWKEEQKARVLIEKGGYEANFNGEAYSSIMFQNANLSVRVTDEFMQAAERDEEWTTHWVTDPSHAGPSFPAREVMNRMAECAWHCGDPGVQYDTTINRWHTCPNSGRINASNPCVTGDTLVATAEGLRPIESLVGENPDVIGGDGNFHQAKAVFRTGRKPVFLLRTVSGYELKLTADHRVLTENRGDVAASNLTSGDQVRLSQFEFGSDELAEFECSEFAESLADRYEASESGGVVLATATDRLLSLVRNSSAAVVRRFYEAHRCDDVQRSEVSMVCDAPETLKAIQLVLLGFGIKSRRSRSSSKISISGSHARRFDLLLGGALDLPDGESALLSDRFASLTPAGEADVFDLTEPVTHHFVAGGIVVHNCSEYMFLDDTACNLASINLMKFRRAGSDGADATFDAAGFRAACRVFFIAQEILVDHASYPTADIARNSHLFRPLGLGYSNLGSLLMAGGLAYDSDAGRGVCGAVTALLHGAANLTSCELAEAVGPFDAYEENREPMLRVMGMHRDAVDRIAPACPEYLRAAAEEVWEEVIAAGPVHGFRNAQATVLAPTGTISFLMDCDTTGIEPDIALVKYKQLAGGGMLKIVNKTVPLALRTLGYDEPQVESIVAHINAHDTIEGAAELDPLHLPVFDCAFEPRGGERSIAWRAHVTMMAAAQPFLSGAISKTVNMPRETTPAEIGEAYTDGWKLGLKALAIYRDGSKESQPLSTSTESDRAAAKAGQEVRIVTKPYRQRLPDTRRSLTHKFSVAGHEGYVTVGLYEDGRPGELFITMAKEGSTIGGLMDAFGTAVSMSLQYGVPLEDYVRKFSHMRFEPQGFTKNPDIRIAKSLIDYIFRWLGITFLPGYREASLGMDAGHGPSDAGAGSGGEASAGDGETEPRPVARKAGGRPSRQDAPAGRSGQSPAPSASLSTAKSAGTAPSSASSDGAAGRQGRPQGGRAGQAGESAGGGASARGANGHGNGHAGGHSNGNGASQKSEAGGGATGTLLGSYLAGYSTQLLERAGVMMVSPPSRATTARDEQFADFQSDAPSCDNCGAITVRSGNCYLCYNCGSSMGCS